MDAATGIYGALSARAYAQQRCLESGFNDRSARLLAKLIGLTDSVCKDPEWECNCLLRSQWFDSRCRQFFKRYPQGMCIDLGAGLSTRFHRLSEADDWPRFSWVDVVLPGITAIKKEAIPKSDNYQLIAADIVREDWLASADWHLDYHLVYRYAPSRYRRGVSQSFRAPNIADLSRYGASRSTEFEVAATELAPETYLTYELGLKQVKQSYYWSANCYYTTISDYIASTPTGNTIHGLTEVSKKNAASGYMQGIELVANLELDAHFSLFSVINWQRGELDIPGTQQREPFSRSMPSSTQWGLEWHSTGSEAWAKVIWQQVSAARRLSAADKEDTERIPPGGTPGYELVSLRAGTTFWSTTQLTLGLENILDETYRTHGSGSNEPGFGVNVSVRIIY